MLLTKQGSATDKSKPEKAPKEPKEDGEDSDSEPQTIEDVFAALRAKKVSNRFLRILSV